VPFITGTITATTSINIIRQLHAELAAAGLPVGVAPTAGPFLTAARTSVSAFQKRHNLSPTGIVDPTTAGILTLSALVISEGDRSKLRVGLRNGLNRVPGSPEYNYWLARYAIMAGDYPTAQSAVSSFGRFDDIGGVLNPHTGSGTPQPLQPELPYPENFYSYREDLLDQDLLAQLLSQMASLTKEQYAAAISTSGHRIDPLTLDDSLFQASVQKAHLALEVISAWQTGNSYAARREFALAILSYQKSQTLAADYFQARDEAPLPGNNGAERVQAWLARRRQIENHPLWEILRWRRILLSLRELEQQDREKTIGSDGAFASAAAFVNKFTDTDEFGANIAAINQMQRLDPLMAVIATLWIPLATAELNAQRRQFDAAIQGVADLLSSQVAVEVRFRYVCEFIEIPFMRLLTVEALLGKADEQYKTGRTQPDVTQFPETVLYHGLLAAQTYLQVLSRISEDGQYAARIAQGRDNLVASIQQSLQVGDTTSRGFQILGKSITVPTISAVSNTLPGTDRALGPHQSIVQIASLDGTAMRETNPQVYALGLLATAKLEQIRAGFNYLGYADDYLSPWRFQFLLDRARYFSEHAKNAQRDYLNFLNNAEHEDLQEQSAAQNVEMEKSNVRIETARVDQVNAEVKAAEESAALAHLSATNAQQRFANYSEFDEKMDSLEAVSFFGSFISSLASATVTSLVNPALGAGVLAAGVVGDTLQAGAAAGKASLQRGLELSNLNLAIGEADKAETVANAQLTVAQDGQIVAGLQRQAALLRHEFAIQNLQFLRNRVLSTEQWYRLVAAIRSVSETYLRYSVELAFLAEQAYEFEADKRINVIRFDYDLSEVGGFLAADFLLRDLDTLEQDLIVTQRQRQQQVRYVLSMAREFPEALQEIRDHGKTTFSLRLEQLEKHFPGLYNLRIGAVDVLPIALMDSTRFSLELTHLGTSQVRLKAQPDTLPGIPSVSPLNTNDLPIPAGGWLSELQEEWPIKLRVTGPETAIFSGLSRQDASAVFPFATNGQRQAFEALGAAAAWQVDLTARENQVVPESLADLLITFTLSGYHDSELRAEIDAVKPQTTTLTSFLSAQQIFPDAFYEFSRSGRMVWKVPRELLTLNGDLGRLRNIGFSLRPGAPNVHFSRLMTRLRMNFRINEAGGVASGVTVFTTIPEMSVTQTAPMTIAVRAALNTASELAWDFGDGTPILRTVRNGTTPIAPAEGAHTYAKPGRYIMKLRCVQNDALAEFRISVVVSRSQKLGEPLIIFLPCVTFNTTAKTLTITAGGAVQQAGRMLWRVGDTSAEGNSATFTLKPGNYTLDFAAVRKLNFRAYSAQRYVKDLAPLPLRGLSATTNRTFDENGKETNGAGAPPLPARNELARRMFDKGAISSEDEWTFELIPQEILGLPAGTAIGAEELDLSDIQDVVLSMEYETTPGGL
jgi:peptidoglycan hydrolase-like protein with peptidoglycan-binding domain